MGQANCTCVKTLNKDEIDYNKTDRRLPEMVLNPNNEIFLLRKIIKI